MTEPDLTGLTDAQRALLEQRLRGTAPAQPAGADPASNGREGTGGIPLSAAQEDVWYLTRVAPDSRVYHEGVVLHRRGALDVEALRRAFDLVVARHEAWRTHFPALGSAVGQRVAPAIAIDFHHVDLSGTSRVDAIATADRLAGELGRREYPLAGPEPLIRPLLTTLGPGEHRLSIALHHLVFDGVSLARTVIPELIAAYDELLADREPKLPPPVPYRQYTTWERAWVDGAEGDRRIAYWRQRLAGAQAVELPLDRPRPAAPSFNGGVEELAVPLPGPGGLDQLLAGASRFHVLAAAFAVVLSRYSGTDDVVFGTIADLRRRAELEPVVGYCMTPVAVRVDLSDDPTFDRLVDRVRREVIDAVDHALPFGRVVRALQPDRAVGVNPLLRVLLVPQPPAPLPDGWQLDLAAAGVGDEIGSSPVDLQVEIEHRSGTELAGRALFDSDILERETVRRLLRHWATVLSAAADAPESPVSRLPLVTRSESEQEISQWNATDVPHRTGVLVGDLIVAQAHRTPAAVAITAADGSVTYEDLLRSAAAVAERLRAQGVRPGDTVAVCADRGVDLVTALLAALLAGAAYLPLDPADPASRLEFALQDSGAVAVLTQSATAARLPPGPPPVIAVDRLPPPTSEAPLPGSGDHARPSDADPAYVIYTSGSTGQPKGVRVQHSAVVNMVDGLMSTLRIAPSDVLVSVCSVTFDVFAGEIWPTLAAGGRVVLASRSDVQDPRRLAEVIAAAGATLMHATPTVWRLLVDAGWAGSPTLTAVSIGEVLPDGLASALLERCRAVWNTYGPTEATVEATADRLVHGRPVTIGRPLPGVRLYLLDRRQQPVPVGLPGEIYLAGHGVALGYVGRESETTQRFLADRYRSGGRMYRTGDLGRRLPDGRVMFLGRLDDQVKVRGVRVEPAEVEAVMAGHPQMSAIAVLAAPDHVTGHRLMAYVVPQDGHVLTPAGVRTWTRQRLPAAMVPSDVIVLDRLPMTPNGKVDRVALSRQRDRPERPASYREPATDLERRLADIWAETLGVEGVGADADFFALGGHSLLAVRMLERVERELDRRVPVAWLLEGGATPAGLAALIEDGGPGQTGSLPRLWFIGRNEATLLAARHLQARLAMRAVVSPLAFPVEDWYLLSVEEVTGDLVREVRSAQPHGPYAVAGFAEGGLLAYEVAGRFRAAGEEVVWVGLLDAPTPSVAREMAAPRATIRRFLHRDARGWARAVADVTGLGMRRLGLGGRDGDGPAPLTWIGPRRSYAFLSAHEVRSHDVATDLFETNPPPGHSGLAEHWRAVHSGVLDCHVVSGRRGYLLLPPAVDPVCDLVVARYLAAIGDPTHHAAVSDLGS